MACIVIVEDEIQVLTLAESILQAAGHETRTAATVAEAQAIIHSEQPLDLVFTDVELRNLADGGVMVGKLAKQTRPDVPILYTSGRGLTSGMQSLLSDGSVFLPKPYNGEQLVDAVDYLLRKAA
jgi:two-component system, cell cycle sensor histidine kinase and response regulator CckA